MYKVLAIATLTASIQFLSASSPLSYLQDGGSYPFSLDNEQVSVTGSLDYKHQQYYWQPADRLEPSLWLTSDKATILDNELSLATVWDYDQFSQLHPFLASWFWLVSIDEKAFETEQGSYGLCHAQWGCYQLTWSPSWLVVHWKDGEGALNSTLTLGRQKQGQSTFAFQMPDNWTVEKG